MLDKRSESLPFEEQVFSSTQIPTAFMYLLWGEYSRLLPESDQNKIMQQETGTYSV
ncbi:hypothetical protein AwDysgo_17270 [Bacteroidales bacterium]|nr:hypothetical protein AwDysgo_17270 [Bacteroidales bacterium]